METQLQRIIAIVLVMASLGPAGGGPAIGPQAEYFISPTGSDRGAGTFESPWATLEHAFGVLEPGDTLTLRGGRYFEHRLTITAAGTAEAPITVRSYPGERAVIDGGVPDFLSVPNAAWEPVNEGIHLYRSRQTFPTDTEVVRAWLVDEDVQLVEYESAENLESTHYGPLNGLAPLYLGPGVHLRADGHLYIRLAPNPLDLTDSTGAPIAPVPADPDPNHHRLAVFFSNYLLKLEGAAHLVFRDLDLAHADYIFDARNGSNAVTVEGCSLRYGNRGIVVREGLRDWVIRDSEFTNGVPEYVYWTDVKNRDGEAAEAYPEFQSVAIGGTLPGFTIEGNVFHHVFDGLRVEEGTVGARIVGNTFIHTHDDAMNLSRGIGDVEVAHNMLWHVMGGIANLASTVAPGPVHIHHNVIDNSEYRRGGRPGNYREDNWPTWNIGSPFAGHDDGNKDSWWRLYNNTVVTRNDPGHSWSPAGPDEVTGNPEKYVLNNIFYVLDERVILRDDDASLGSHYDGNVFYRGRPQDLPLFTSFGNGGRFESLAEFRAASGTDWEIHGLEVDPGFDREALADGAYDPQTIWERYRPTNPQVLTAGAPTEGLGWPGTEGVTYRGAVGPAPD
jgi:hypothetical protein